MSVYLSVCLCLLRLHYYPQVLSTAWQLQVHKISLFVCDQWAFAAKAAQSGRPAFNFFSRFAPGPTPDHYWLSSNNVFLKVIHSLIDLFLSSPYM